MSYLFHSSEILSFCRIRERNIEFDAKCVPVAYISTILFGRAASGFLDKVGTLGTWNSLAKNSIFKMVKNANTDSSKREEQKNRHFAIFDRTKFRN